MARDDSRQDTDTVSVSVVVSTHDMVAAGETGAASPQVKPGDR